MTDSQKKTIIELRNEGVSYRQIGKLIGLNHGTVCKFCQQIGLDGIRAEKHVWDDPNEYLSKYNPNLEYVSGWTSVDGHAVIRFKDCGHEYKCSMKTVRSHPEYSCQICKEIRQQETERQKANERERKLRQKEDQKLERFWSQNFNQDSFKICPVCRSVFYGKRKIFCSDKCMNYKSAQRHHDRRHELIRKRTVDKDITLKGLSERFGGVCYICGDHCDWSDHKIVDGTFIAGDTYPSIDHIIPIAEGGVHSWDNIQLAHRKCNWERWQNKNV